MLTAIVPWVLATLEASLVLVLALSQLVLLLVLLRRGRWRVMPAFTVYLLFAVISSITYDPRHATAFAWMSIPSFLLRSIAYIECVWLLTARQLEPARALLMVAGITGALIVLSAAWGLENRYGWAITLSVYCSIGLAGAIWTVIGILWRKDALVRDWRRGYAVALGVYLAVTAVARMGGAFWSVAQNTSMTIYIVIFFWLAKKFSNSLSDPRPTHLDNEYNQHNNSRYKQIAV